VFGLYGLFISEIDVRFDGLYIEPPLKMAYPLKNSGNSKVKLNRDIRDWFLDDARPQGSRGRYQLGRLLAGFFMVFSFCLSLASQP
jgi:hypothetical protein